MDLTPDTRAELAEHRREIRRLLTMLAGMVPNMDEETANELRCDLSKIAEQLQRWTEV